MPAYGAIAKAASASRVRADDSSNGGGILRGIRPEELPGFRGLVLQVAQGEPSTAACCTLRDIQSLEARKRNHHSTVGNPGASESCAGAGYRDGCTLFVGFADDLSEFAYRSRLQHPVGATAVARRILEELIYCK